MKAWQVEAHGGVEALALKEIESPIAGPGEVRIRVEAVGLNHLDIWVRKGVTGHQFPLPLTLGCDTTGVIESVGAGTEKSLSVLGLSIGSAVIVSPGLSCGVCEPCLSGQDPLCSKYGILGETTNGGCADFLVVPIQNLIPRPGNISAEMGCAIQIPYLTAYSMLVSKAALRAGERVLIHAGGSSVSVAAIQIAKMLGAHVTTTVGSSSKVEPATKTGADVVIEYKKASLKDQLLKTRFDVVVDHVGQDTFSDSIRFLKWGGRLVTCGATSGSEVKIDLKALFFKNLSFFGTTMGSKADLIRIVKLVEDRKLNPVIDQVFSMQEYPKAQSRLESREGFGKVIVKVEQ